MSGPRTDRTTQAFLSEIFEPDGEQLDAGAQIAVWNKSTHGTLLAGSADEAADLACEDDVRDVAYFGVCPRDVAAMRNRAAKEGRTLGALQGDRTECASMPGVWVDIDVVASGHQKKNLAPNVAAALEALGQAVPLEPTITVLTGGGIHAYWLFGEGVIPFAAPGRENSREDLEMLVRSFQAMVRDELQGRGWADDQTWALPRVMRLPGGCNTSHGGDPIPVSWEKTSRRYGVDELRGVVPAGLDLIVRPKQAPAAQTADVRFDMRTERELKTDADMLDLIDMMSESDPDVFGRAWTRRDRKGDTSQSGRDMTIACCLIRDGVHDQCIVDILRWHRLSASRHVDANPEKADRADYYERTVGNARRLIGEEATSAAVSDAADIRASDVVDALAASTGEDGPSEEAVDGGLATLNLTLGMPAECPVTEIRREPAADAARDRYTLMFGTAGALSLPSTALSTPTALVNALPMAAGVALPAWKIKKPEDRARWVRAQLLIRALATTPTEDAHAELSEACEAIVACAVAMFDDFGVQEPCLSEKWADGVLERCPAIWTTNRGSRDPALLVPRADLANETAKVLTKEAQALVRGVFGTVGGFEAVPTQVLNGSEGRRTRRGLVRIRLAALRKHGSDEEAEHILRRMASHGGDA